MKLVQITLPKERARQVYDLLERHASHTPIAGIVELRAKNASILQFRVENQHVLSVQTLMQKSGVGIKYGYCDIMELAAGTTVGEIAQKTPKKDRGWFRPTPSVLFTTLYKNIEANSYLTLDTLFLLAASSAVAGIGLATDNQVYVVASMLISPLMGPLNAAAFGLAIFDREMYLRGIRNEFLALLLTLALGAALGAGFAPFAEVLIWPTGEMAGRGIHVELLFSGAVAIAGGLAAAVSECNANVSSIVGIAIAASILPPTVNAGMCAAYARVGPLLGHEVHVAAYYQIAWTSFVLLVVNIFFIYTAAAMVYFSRASLDRFNYKRHDREELAAGINKSTRDVLSSVSDSEHRRGSLSSIGLFGFLPRRKSSSKLKSEGGKGKLLSLRKTGGPKKDEEGNNEAIQIQSPGRRNMT